MIEQQAKRYLRTLLISTAALWVATMLSGCGPSYSEIRADGVRMMIERNYGPARFLLLEADQLKRNQVENLHDLGFCSIMLAKQHIEAQNRVAALREVDRSLEFYERAIDAHPGHQPSLVGKNIALELQGNPEIALKHAQWAVRVVGPSARQYLFLATELDQRGDLDGALLRFRQAVAIEPSNASAHAAFARFLLRHDNVNAGVDHLKIAFKLDSGDSWVREQLASRGELPPPPQETRTNP